MNAMEEMQARIDLTEAKARYCRFLDTKQWQQWQDLMVEDFTLDVTEGTQLPLIHGREKAVAQVRSSLETAATAHQVHTPEITFNSDDEAEVIWPMQDRVVWGEGKPSLVGYGHYYERWVRQSGDWKIARLRLSRLHVDFLPPQAG